MLFLLTAAGAAVPARAAVAGAAVPAHAAVAGAAIPAHAAVAAAASVAAAPGAAAPGAAAPVAVGPINITVPAGFQAAQTQKLKKTLITAWSRSVKGGKTKTLLQLEVLDSPKPDSAEKYLHQALNTLSRRRANFSASPVAHITLAGAPAVRQSWNGVIGGYPVVGVLYSVVLKDRYVVKFLTQDLGSTPTDGLFEAMQAIESIVMS